MILRNKKTIPVVKGVTDLRDAEKLMPPSAPRPFATAYPLPALPAWCNKDYRFGRERCNPCTVTCTCAVWQQRAALVPPRDLRCCCPHLTRLLLQRLAPELGALVVLLLKTQNSFGPEELETLHLPEADAVLTGSTRGAAWVNVYAGSPPARFSYSPAKQRWSHGALPPHAAAIARLLTQKYGG